MCYVFFSFFFFEFKWLVVLLKLTDAALKWLKHIFDLVVDVVLSKKLLSTGNCGRTGFTGPTGRTGPSPDPSDPTAYCTHTSLAQLLASSSPE